MKLLLGTFNLLMSVIIIINFIFIMKDFIKNWFSINSNSCNYKVLSSVEYRTKLFIFKLFYHVNGGEMIDINSCFKELDKDINLCILIYEEQVI
mgnify:FL=1